jgi:hypothetical protein
VVAVYLKVDADCPPEVGCTSKHEFKGPYHLNTTSEIMRIERPREFEVKVVGDLTGRGVWTLTPRDGGVHIQDGSPAVSRRSGDAPDRPRSRAR